MGVRLANRRIDVRITHANRKGFEKLSQAVRTLNLPLECKAKVVTYLKEEEWVILVHLVTKLTFSTLSNNNALDK